MHGLIVSQLSDQIIDQEGHFSGVKVANCAQIITMRYGDSLKQWNSGSGASLRLSHSDDDDDDDENDVVDNDDDQDDDKFYDDNVDYPDVTVSPNDSKLILPDLPFSWAHLRHK